MMIKRGPLVAVFGIMIVLCSVFVAATIPTNVTAGNLSAMLEGIFDHVSEVSILPGGTAVVSYNALSSDAPLLFVIQIIDFQPGDQLSVDVLNIFGDEYGRFTQRQEILFEFLEIPRSDTLDFKLANDGARPITVVAMFANDLRPDAMIGSEPATSTIISLLVSGFLLILGMLVGVIGAAITLLDLKNNRNKIY